MAAIDFPNSPTVGQVFTSGDRSWSWTGTTWDARGVVSFTPSATPPSSPVPGDMWFDSNTGKTYIWYDSYWVEMTGSPAVTDAGLLTGTTLAPNIVYSSMPRGYRNRVDNGGFDVWQRGGGPFTTQAMAADRWFLVTTGSTHTVTRQSFTLGNAIAGYEPTYFWRSVVVTSAGSTNRAFVQHSVEDVRTFAGQTTTVSFWAKADVSKNIAVEIEQYFGLGGTPSSSVATFAATCALTTSWQRFTVTVGVPSISGKTLGTTADTHKMMVNLWFDAGSSFNSRTNSLGQQSGTFDFWGVQLEAGPVATPFEVLPLADTLRQCQRHFCKTYPLNVAPGSSGSPGAVIGQGSGDTVGFGSQLAWRFPVPMRGSPSAVTAYNPITGTAGEGRNFAISTNITAQMNSGFYSADGIEVTLTTASGGAGHQIGAHFTASAEL